MPKYIERERLSMNILGLTVVDPSVAQYAEAVLQCIKDAPAADVVPVVRCKECKYFNYEMHECECDDVATDLEGGAQFRINFYDDDFCSYGERRDGGDNDAE